VAHVSYNDEPDDDQTLALHGVYLADADINDVSGCKASNVKVTLHLQELLSKKRLGSLDIGIVFQKMPALFCIHLDMYSYRKSAVANVFILNWSLLL
jgi:hypothetical protein